MLEPELIAFLEGGCATTVGTVGPAGDPHVARGWGTTVDADRVRLRLLLSADDEAVVALASGGARMAITGADVPTFRSVQLKGRSLGTEAGSPADEDRADRYCDAFFSDIVTTDGTPRRLLERMRPAGYVACIVEVEEVFDQTPGPQAGAPLT